MIIKSAQFVTSAVTPAHYPLPDLPEIAFSGRSNVGKSSMINTLVRRKHLVKTGSTPGRTQLINFFCINNAFFLVDLPGYGYAKVPKHVKKQWAPMIETYLTSRPTLKGVVLILDIRRTPGPQEQAFIPWLKHHHRRCIPILTKADKLSKSKQLSQRQVIARELALKPKDLILFSAKTRQGRSDIWQVLEAVMGIS